MTETALSSPQPHHPSDNRPGNTLTKILASVAVLALAGGFFTFASLALFTDQESVDANAFATGTLDLTTSDNTALFTASAMVPGDQVTQPLTMGNNGTVELRYSATSETTEDTLAGQLVVTIKTGVSDCSNGGFAADGTQIHQGPLGATAPGIALFGDNTAGQDTGDRVLAAGANEVLCFNVALPIAATAQGASTTATFTFDAEQTANNG